MSVSGTRWGHFLQAEGSIPGSTWEVENSPAPSIPTPPPEHWVGCEVLAFRVRTEFGFHALEVMLC